MARAGAIRNILLPFRSFSVCLRWPRAIRILLLSFSSFSFCLRWPGRSHPNSPFCPSAFTFVFSLSKMAGPEPSEFAGSACSFVFSLSKMARARAIRILLLPVRSFSVVQDGPGPAASEFSLPFSFVVSLFEMARPSEFSFCIFRSLSVCLRWPRPEPSDFSLLRFLPFRSFSGCLRHPNSPSALSFVFRSGPKPSEFSFCLFVRFQFVEDGPGRSHPSPSALSFPFDFSFCLFVRLQFV